VVKHAIANPPIWRGAVIVAWVISAVPIRAIFACPLVNGAFNDTVKKNVSNVLGNLGAANRTEVVALAREFSLMR
jgi:hypothetical protein